MSAEHKLVIMNSNKDKVKVSLGTDYLYTWEGEIEEPIIVAIGPNGNGTRAVIEIAKDTGRMHGPALALNGRVVGPSSDWILIGTDGTVSLDVRLLIQTKDEQIIYQKIIGRSIRDDEDDPSNDTIQNASAYNTYFPYLDEKCVTELCIMPYRRGLNSEDHDRGGGDSSGYGYGQVINSDCEGALHLSTGKSMKNIRPRAT